MFDGPEEMNVSAYISFEVALTSRNSGSVRTRTVGSALYNMCVQTSNVFSSNVS